MERVFVYGLIFGIVLNIAFWAPAFFFPELMIWWATSPFAFISILVPGQFLTTFAAALWSQAYIEVGVMPKWILYGGYYAPLVTGMIYAGVFSLVARVSKKSRSIDKHSL